MTLRETTEGRTRVAAALAGAVLTWACGEPIHDPGLIEHSRVLGARVEVAAAPERASPAPGERATLRWLVADPEPARLLSWSMIVCEAEEVARGLPICARPPFFSAESGAPRLAQPILELTVPAEAELAGKPRLVVQGVVCADGVARLGSSWPDSRCEGDGAERTLVMQYVFVERAGFSNHNPSLVELGVWLDGEPWAAPDPDWPPSQPCTEGPPDLRRVAAGSGEHRIELAPDQASREPLDDDPLGRSLETLQLSHFVTAGEIERPFSAIEGEDADPSVTLSWVAPSTAPAGGTRVRLYVVARALRGGADWTLRTLCVTP